eukprot:2012223-Pyramimonas_sp.AAC.1
MPHEHEGGAVADGAEHDEEAIADHEHVPEINSHRLHGTCNKTCNSDRRRVATRSPGPFAVTCGVITEEGGLHEAGHVRAGKVVVEAVAVDEQAGAAAAHHGAPPPLVVLHRELEVRQRDGDERRHDEQDDEHDEEDGVNGVHLVRHAENARIAQSAERGTLS